MGPHSALSDVGKKHEVAAFSPARALLNDLVSIPVVMKILIGRPPPSTPPIEIAKGVLFVMRLAAWCLSFQMIENTAWLIDDLVAVISDFQAQIHIFKSISKRLIKTADLFKNRSPNQTAGARHNLKFPSLIDSGMLR